MRYPACSDCMCGDTPCAIDRHHGRDKRGASVAFAILIGAFITATVIAGVRVTHTVAQTKAVVVSGCYVWHDGHTSC
jgi:hypothetical protein